MMFPRRVPFVIPVLLALSGTVGAEILTVGPPGSGAQFGEVQDAIDAAAPNDVILIRPGDYGGIVVNKPLRILGDGTGPVLIASDQPVGALIQGIGAGDEVVLSGVRVRGTPVFFPENNYAIHVDACAGTVVLHDVLISTVRSQIGVRVESSARVVMLSCRLQDAGTDGTAAVDVTSSTLWVADSTIVGFSPEDGFHFLRSGAHAIRSQSSTLYVWRSTLQGGDANDAFLEAFGSALGGAGVLAEDSSVELFGGPVGSVSGGGGSLAPLVSLNSPGSPALDLFNCSFARLQADLPLAGGFDGADTLQADAVRVDGSSSTTTTPFVFPTLASDAQQAALGGSFNLTLEGAFPGLQILFLSFDTGPTLSLPWLEGVGLLGRNTLTIVGARFIPRAGVAVVPLNVPTTAELLGLTAFFQTVQVGGRRPALSNPIMVTVTL